MKIYLDNCCLNRPFEDQSNLRVRLESEVVKVFLQQFDHGHGDYVQDRQAWQRGYSVDSLLEAIEKEQ